MNGAQSKYVSVIIVLLIRLMHLMVATAAFQSEEETTKLESQTYSLLVIITNWHKLKFLNSTSSSSHLKTSQASSSSCCANKVRKKTIIRQPTLFFSTPTVINSKRS